MQCWGFAWATIQPPGRTLAATAAYEHVPRPAALRRNLPHSSLFFVAPPPTPQLSAVQLPLQPTLPPSPPATASTAAISTPPPSTRHVAPFFSFSTHPPR
eukprot:4765045-Prymnesium_polylepis.1